MQSYEEKKESLKKDCEAPFSISHGIFNFVKRSYREAICYSTLIPYIPTPDLKMLFWNNVTADKQKYLCHKYSLETAQSPTVHVLEKLHGFAMKMWKKYWQIGILTSTILSRWHTAGSNPTGFIPRKFGKIIIWS